MIRPELPSYDLVLLNTPARDYASFAEDDESLMPSLGLGSIATYLENDWNVGILDAEFLKIPIKNVVDYLEVCNTEYVGLNATSENIAIVMEIAEQLPQKIVLGGIHASLAPEETMEKYPFLYALVHGEGEEPIAKILKGTPLKEIPGVAFCEQSRVTVNGRSSLLDLSQLPIINRDFFEPTENFHLITSRGCPHNCAFCASPVLCGRIVRFEPIEKIREEMLLAYERGYRYFHFLDDQFLVTSKRAREFLEMLCDINIYGKITWRGMARVDVILRMNNGILQELKESGGEILSVGIESGCKRIIKMVHKKTNNGMVKLTVKKLIDTGFVPKGFFMLGFPTETYREMLETKQLIMELGELGLRRFSIAIFRPYPGTEIFHHLIGQGYSPEEIFYENPIRLNEDIPTKYLHGYCNHLNRNIQISQVPNKKIRELIKEIIIEFERQFGQKNG